MNHEYSENRKKKFLNERNNLQSTKYNRKKFSNDLIKIQIIELWQFCA